MGTILASNFDIKGVPAIIFAIIGVLTALAAAAAIIRATYAKTQIEALRGDRDDLVARVGILEQENTRLKADLDTEAEKRKALETVVTARREIGELRALLERHHETALSAEKTIKAVEVKVNNIARLVQQR
jgi:hypothetical protein